MAFSYRQGPYSALGGRTPLVGHCPKLDIANPIRRWALSLEPRRILSKGRGAAQTPEKHPLRVLTRSPW